MNLLFICNQNQNRSKTAQEIFKNKFKTKSAGLFNKKPVTSKEITWANTVVVMEDEQVDEIVKRFPKQYMQKRVFSLDVPDIYHYQEPKLIKILQAKMKEYSYLFNEDK